MTEDITFSVERLPFRTELPDSALYNKSAYLMAYSHTEHLRFATYESGILTTYLNLTIDKDGAFNSLFSGFGGVEMRIGFIHHLDFLFKHVILWCRTNGIRKIELKEPAEIYTTFRYEIEQTLKINNFKICYTEINQHLKISDIDYHVQIKKNEKKRLKKCDNAGFHFNQLNINQLTEAYAIIKDNRTRKGFPVTMSFSDLNTMFKAFHNDYLLFGVYDGRKLLAVTISIKVKSNTLYNFYHGDVADYRNFSPIVKVMEGVYNYCRNHGITYLDLGISSEKGILNQGLYNFKKNCGAVQSEKKSWILTLHDSYILTRARTIHFFPSV